ncbi:FCD domain-containing protein, partial [Burkholderia pseudomallei]|uniref:FCD domain-containing protein n=1 Tax=Burkholderia pseudomallei TaxID=28450 RepID=UPI000CCEDB2C
VGQRRLLGAYQMRYALEGFGARMAAPAVSEEDLAWSEENVAALQEALANDQLDSASQPDCDWRTRIVNLVGNAAIESIPRGSPDIMTDTQRMPVYRRELVLSTQRDPRTSLAALIAKDPAAAGAASKRPTRTPG